VRLRTIARTKRNGVAWLLSSAPSKPSTSAEAEHRALAEQHRAEAAEERAQRYAARLREMGIEPD
jgi:hypothetical protein